MREKLPLSVSHPDLAKEWHPEKNGSLTPDDVTHGSGKKVWWICDKGHEWESRILDRKSKRTGCPICTNRIVLPGFNDLATTHPKLAKEWHPVKNGELTPENVTFGSNRKVWWKCEKGHGWQVVIYSRVAGNNCPVCNRFVSDKKSLAVVHPELLGEWHPQKNGALTPKDVSCGSNKRVWWVCKKGHEWQGRIADRANGHGCPYCSGRMAGSKKEKIIK